MLDLGGAVVVVPTVIEEGDAVVYAGMDEADALCGVALCAEMVAAHADGGDSLAGCTKFAVDHVRGLGAFDRCGWVGGLRVGCDRCTDAGDCCALEKGPSFHTALHGRGSTATVRFDAGLRFGG